MQAEAQKLKEHHLPCTTPETQALPDGYREAGYKMKQTCWAFKWYCQGAAQVRMRLTTSSKPVRPELRVTPETVPKQIEYRKTQWVDSANMLAYTRTYG